jgi:hypothetical protein
VSDVGRLRDDAFADFGEQLVDADPGVWKRLVTKRLEDGSVEDGYHRPCRGRTFEVLQQPDQTRSGRGDQRLVQVQRRHRDEEWSHDAPGGLYVLAVLL